MTNRFSNIEALRLMAMLLVVLIHIFPLALGFPSFEEVHQEPGGAFVRFLMESLAVVCVNVFVFISGWFGIKIKIDKILALAFQVLFFSSLVYFVLVCTIPDKYLNFRSISTVLLLNSSDYWFVKAYIGLIIISPALNSLVENYERSKVLFVIVAFYIFQTVYGWVSLYGANWFEGGYSAMSFVGIYLLAKFLHKYPIRKVDNYRSWQYLVLYLIIAMLQTIVAFVLTYSGMEVAGRLFTYTNPIVIVQTICLFYVFEKMEFHSGIINKMAASCLAVYLLHANELVLRTYFGPMILSWYKQCPPMSFVAMIILLIISLFIMAYLLDQIRIYLWNGINKLVSKNLD